MLQNKNISIVIPCFNSEKTIEKVVNLIMQVFAEHDEYNCQIILVNDSSKDSTFQSIKKCCVEFDNVTGIDLSINTGQHNAIMAGLKYADGELILCMDDDLQTHPSQIFKIIDKIEDGYDLVFGTYPEVKQNIFRRFGSRFNSATVNFLLGTRKDIKVTSFFCMRRFLKDSIINYNNSYTHLRGLLLNATDNIGMVEVEHFKREIGQSTYTLKKLIRLWSSCINFSIIPLRFASFAGLFTAVLGIILAAAIVIKKLLNPEVAVGWTSTIACMLFFMGLTLLCLGVIGEYIGRIFLAINNSPQYVIRDVVHKKSLDAEELEKKHIRSDN